MIGTRYCAACDVFMHADLWPSHYRSAQHRISLRRDEAQPRTLAGVLLWMSSILCVLAIANVALHGWTVDAAAIALFLVAALCFVGALVVANR